MGQRNIILIKQHRWSYKMAYVGNNYTKDDFQNIVVDGLGTVGAAIVEWLDLIVLLIILGFIIGIFVKLAALFK